MNRKNRPILIVIGNYTNGGIARHAVMLANGLSKHNKEVTIIVTKECSETSFFKTDNKVKIVSIHDEIGWTSEYKSKENKILRRIKIIKYINEFLPDSISLKKFIGRSVSKRRNTLSLKRVFMMYKNPIIIAFGLDYAIDSFYAAKGIKCNLIFGTRTNASGEIAGKDEKFLKYIMKKFDVIVCQTEYNMKYLSKYNLKKSCVIGNPMQIEDVIHKGSREEKIVNFCRISEEKRIDLLIRAYSVFYKKFPQYTVEIYGNSLTVEEQKYYQKIQGLIVELGLSDRVRIHNARKDIHTIVKNASMFISTSDYEGLSNSMIEAMALGLPCICTDCEGGGAKEYIVNGENGLLIPTNDEQALINAMMLLAEDKEFAEKCGKNAQKVREKLKIESIALQWIEAIEKYCR